MTDQPPHIAAAIKALSELRAALKDDPQILLSDTLAAEARVMNAMSLLTDEETRIVEDAQHN